MPLCGKSPARGQEAQNGLFPLCERFPRGRRSGDLTTTPKPNCGHPWHAGNQPASRAGALPFRPLDALSSTDPAACDPSRRAAHIFLPFGDGTILLLPPTDLAHPDRWNESGSDSGPGRLSRGNVFWSFVRREGRAGGV